MPLEPPGEVWEHSSWKWDISILSKCSRTVLRKPSDMGPSCGADLLSKVHVEG